ncbi:MULTISPECIES: anthranilate phosphoribosyltransferase [Auritidibacter]|uniref:Anthranilate phosphoribosyltransferase n=1 Tax=Auritidibacter ignavus TaxID=678932 RepID=A0AAJ6DF83_9MICC|nr:MULTISPECIES: anthranilate phosphoribosyltransferase [Auritidibacter]PXA79102.1 anthranilate phosphoribosyltransferase [Auritidibacter sp. NML120779]PXA77834.1 anthranilate phosphoribosyltransferase [Auritidibacter sp. NML100628]WGH82166.1 anthranilate phosphoribosyltransferase [Auritidibacter ignavus]WGH84425.1 anthranilate phosphoribosyltransferase [Auritidibacter ignavus]WGH93748.1 anthranilate phosphoribosyltransferase [Auritidibacter ignavus]
MHTQSSSSDLTWPTILTSVINKEDLSVDVASWAMTEMMSGNASDAQIAGFLVALAAKGETVDELMGLANAMLEQAAEIELSPDAVDIVGTGGDRLGTVNLSTMSSLVAVGAGAKVIKHGNRGSSSTAGAADVIEALGVDLTMAHSRAAQCLERAGITFLFAQEYHPSMRYVAPTRKQLGVPTAFNYLGPLSNPARPDAQALGCANEAMAPKLAGVLRDRGTRGMVFRGCDGRDKITTSGPSTIYEVRDGSVEHYELNPQDFGISLQPVEALAGKDGDYNATIVRDLLAGKPGPVRDAVLLNTGAGLTAYDTKSEGHLFERIQKNMARAEEAIDSGAAAEVLNAWVAVSQGE